MKTFNIDAEDKFLAQVGGTRDGFEFTIGELRQAFDRVSPAPNWKTQIDATIEIDDARDMALIREAVLFMTGSVPNITPTKSFLSGRAKKTFRVEADGYYHDIGA